MQNDYYGMEAKMLLDGEIITNGTQIIGYLDKKLAEVQAAKQMATGIVIGSRARKYLTEACQKVMGMPLKQEETVNLFRGTILIEDGNSEDRVEVISAVAPTMPVPNDAFKGGLRRIG